MSSPGNRAGCAVRVCRFFLTQVLLWFCLELPRKESAKGGGICDSRVEVHPVNWLTPEGPEVKNPETQPHVTVCVRAETRKGLYIQL